MHIKEENTNGCHNTQMQTEVGQEKWDKSKGVVKPLLKQRRVRKVDLLTQCC